MTSNQIAYQNMLENQRHNVAAEFETARSNKAREAETRRSNLANEDLKAYDVATSGIERITKGFYNVGKTLTGFHLFD